MKPECQNLLMNTKLVNEKYTKKYSKRNSIQEKRKESPDYPESQEEWEDCEEKK